jgi:ATP-dependent DNA ligase
MNCYEVIKELENTPGTNDKLAILKREHANEDLRQFFFMARNPHLVFGIKIMPAAERHNDEMPLVEAMMELYKFSRRELTGHAALDHLKHILTYVSKENADLIRRIVQKDPDCKVSHKSLNKVWKKLIPVTGYMRCKSSTSENLSKIDFPAVIQKKADGLFINCILRSGQPGFLTRNGKPMDFLGKLDSELKEMIGSGKDFVLTGEGQVSDGKGGVLDRKTGNGIINKAIHGTISDAEASLVIIEVWDIIPLEAWESGKFDLYDYERRLGLLKKIFSNGPTFTKFSLIETKTINSMDEADAYFKYMISTGEEGAILKNLDGKWKNHTSPDQVKMKIKDPADLICVGTTEHSKTPGWIGALILESAEGIIKVKTGSGLTELDRQQEPDFYIGKIIETEYNEITSDKKTGQKSLFLPIFIGIRDDKDEADSYELIVERSSTKKKK